MARSPTPKTDRLREMREDRYASDQSQREIKKKLQKTTDGDAQKTPEPKHK